MLEAGERAAGQAKTKNIAVKCGVQDVTECFTTIEWALVSWATAILAITFEDITEGSK